MTSGERAERRAVARSAWTFGALVGCYGVSFGAAAAAAGLTVAQAVVLSSVMFTGASQFALAGVVALAPGPGGLAAGVLSAGLLGLRNGLYAVRLAQLLPQRGVRRLLAAHLTLDETTALADGVPARHAGVAFWVGGAALFTCWNLATLLGVLGAARLGDPAAVGLDVVAPAAFLALLWPRLTTATTEPALRLALLGGAVALVALPWAPVGVPVLLAAAAGALVLLRRGP